MRVAAGPALLFTVAGVVAGLLLIVTEFTTVASVDVGVGESCESRLATEENADRCSLSGFERHGGAFVLLGILAIAMAWGAGVGGSRPAAVALIAIGAIVLVWGIAFDLPEADRTGAIGRNFEGATGEKGAGLYLEIVAGALAAGTGLLRLLGRPV